MRKIGITPDKIILPNVNSPISRYIFVRPANIQDFKIEKIVAPRDDIKVDIEQMQNEGYRIQLSNINPSNDMDKKFLIIKTNIPGESEIKVPFIVNK